MSAGDTIRSDPPPTPDRQVRERKRRSSTNSHQYCSWAESAVAGSDNAVALPTPLASPEVENQQGQLDGPPQMVIMDCCGNLLKPTGPWIEVTCAKAAASRESVTSEGTEAESHIDEQPPLPTTWLPVVDGVPIIPPEMVLLHVYDIGEEGTGADILHALNEMSTVNNSILIGGIFHAGVEIYGREWAYGGNPDGTGVYESPPRADPKHTYRATVAMGTTTLSQGDLHALLKRLMVEWHGNAYHLVHRNCLSFCNTFCQEVGVGCLPGWIDRAPRTAAYIDNALQAAEESLQETGVPDAIDDAQALMSEAILQAVTPAFQKVVEHTTIQSETLEDAGLIASEVVFQAAERVRRCSVHAAEVVGDRTVRAAEVVQAKTVVAGEAICMATDKILDEVGLDSETLDDAQTLASEVAQRCADGVRRRSSVICDAWEDVLVNVGVRSVLDETILPTMGQVFDDAALAIGEVPRVYEENTVIDDASQVLQDAGQAIEDAGTRIEEVLKGSFGVISRTGVPGAIHSAGCFASEVIIDAADAVTDLHPQVEKATKEAKRGSIAVAGAFCDAAVDSVSSTAQAVRRGSSILAGETILVAEEAPGVLESAVEAVRRVSLTVLSVIPASDDCSTSPSDIAGQQNTVNPMSAPHEAAKSTSAAGAVAADASSEPALYVAASAADTTGLVNCMAAAAAAADATGDPLPALVNYVAAAAADTSREPAAALEHCMAASAGAATISEPEPAASSRHTVFRAVDQSAVSSEPVYSPTLSEMLGALPFSWPETLLGEEEHKHAKKKKKRKKWQVVAQAAMAQARSEQGALVIGPEINPYTSAMQSRTAKKHKDKWRLAAEAALSEAKLENGSMPFDSESVWPQSRAVEDRTVKKGKQKHRLTAQAPASVDNRTSAIRTVAAHPKASSAVGSGAVKNAAGEEDAHVPIFRGYNNRG